VEQRYRDTWQRYTRALRQRNAALRAQASTGEITAWDTELLETALAINTFRCDYLKNLSPYLQAEMKRLLPDTELSLHYQRGWPVNKDLADVLTESLSRDLAHGYTQQGPHRADFHLMLDGHPVSAHCSRGQQKSILLALLLAQVCYQQSVMGTAGAFLLDDLTSELDEAHQSRVLAALRDLHAQVFVTAIRAESVDQSVWQPGCLFHVEHGVIREVI
ncbi:MAG: DNA replication and repair protein RecF, partial [Gammaproteobacteria bacterium]